MNKTVIIKCDDQGQYSVGLQPQSEGDEASAMPGEPEMNPVDDLNAALRTAKDLLTSDAAQDAENETEFRKGYDSVEQLTTEGMK